MNQRDDLVGRNNIFLSANGHPLALEWESMLFTSIVSPNVSWTLLTSLSRAIKVCFSTKKLVFRMVLHLYE